MAAVVVLAAVVQQGVSVWVASGADDVVYRAAIRVDAVPIEAVVGDGRHRAQVGNVGPQRIASGDMSAVERTRFAGEEPFAEVMRVPKVEVADLRAVNAGDADGLARFRVERRGLTRGGDA